MAGRVIRMRGVSDRVAVAGPLTGEAGRDNTVTLTLTKGEVSTLKGLLLNWSIVLGGQEGKELDNLRMKIQGQQ